jgi:hypothetical protein
MGMHHQASGGLRLIAHIVENPALMQAVRALEPSVLGRVIESVGLESAGDLIALATTRQLAAVLDEDLWATRGSDPVEHFDAARFGAWLGVLLEAGEQVVVERLCDLPLDFVTLAFHGLVLVVDIDRLGVELADGDDDLEQLEKALDGCLCEEWEEFRLIARDASNWDAALTTLLALDRDHHDVLRAILERCAAMSSEYIADNGGLYEVLTQEQTLEADVGAGREDRRAALGFVSPADAKSFLELARRDASEPRDPITRAYFRELLPDSERGTERLSADEPADVSPLLRLLERAEIVDNVEPLTRALSGTVEPSATSEPSSILVATFRGALSELRLLAPDVHGERVEELWYLANVLISDSRARRRSLRPVEALEAAMAVSGYGLSLGVSTSRHERALSVARAAARLRESHVDRLFAAGFHALHGPEPKDAASRRLVESLHALLQSPD